jgi:DNA repair exonuclease SbcCD ATPase subunit
MARPSDREFALHRKIKDLEENNRKLEVEIAKLRKQIDKAEASANKDLTVPKKLAKLVSKPCPLCGAELKVTDLPHAVMELCSAACGHRTVRSKK